MEIWQEIASDRDAGTRRLVAEYGDRLMTAASILCKDESAAEDLVFRAFEKAVGKIGQYSGKSPFYNWLYSIVFHIFQSDCRKMRAELFTMGEVPERAVSAWEACSGKLAPDECLVVKEAVQSLPPQFREAVVLRYYEDKSLQEISEILSISVNTVKSRLRLAYGRLNGILSGKIGKGVVK